MNLRNTLTTTALLGALTGLLVLAGGALGGRTGMVIALIFAALMNFGMYWFSDKLALKMSGAREVSEADQPELHRMVADLAARANIPKPRVYIINSEAPNAFATGRNPKHGAVAVTSGIARLLTRDELAGVIAHELAHIKNRDTLISAVSATVAGAITMLADMAMWAMFFGGFGGDEEEGGGLGSLVGGIVMIFLAPIAATIIQMAISRTREYRADAGGAQILGDPLPLASALEKLEWAAGRVPPPTSNPSAAHQFIVNPLRGEGLINLFRTHPATSERIARLRALSLSGRGSAGVAVR